MASSKIISSSASNSRNSDLPRLPNTAKPKPAPSPPSSSSANQTLNATSSYIDTADPAPPLQLGSMSMDGLFRDVYNNNSLAPGEAGLLDAQIALMDSAGMAIERPPTRLKTVDEVWQEIESGGESRKECKEELPEEMMTLEDFLARAGAVEEEDIKDLHLVPQPPPETERLSGGMLGFDQIALSPFPSIEKVEGSTVVFGNGGDGEVVVASGGGGGGGGSGRGRGKRPRAVLEPLDKAAQQRQRRMIKNRESAARSRERKQAYQNELESLAVKLEEENERLLREKVIKM